MSHYSDTYYDYPPQSPGSVVGLDVVEDKVVNNRSQYEVEIDPFDGWLPGEQWTRLVPEGGVLCDGPGLSVVNDHSRQGYPR